MRFRRKNKSPKTASLAIQNCFLCCFVVLAFATSAVFAKIVGIRTNLKKRRHLQAKKNFLRCFVVLAFARFVLAQIFGAPSCRTFRLIPVSVWHCLLRRIFNINHKRKNGFTRSESVLSIVGYQSTIPLRARQVLQFLRLLLGKGCSFPCCTLV